MSRRGTAVLAAALALSAPGAALAQSAGDDEYRDPFAGEDQPQDGGGAGGSDGGGSTGGGAPSAPAPAPTPTPTPAPAAEPGAVEPAATTAATLPRTGAAVGAGWVAAAGFLLLAAGVGLRRSVRT